jgi:hypothetical protein
LTEFIEKILQDLLKKSELALGIQVLLDQLDLLVLREGQLVLQDLQEVGEQVPLDQWVRQVRREKLAQAQQVPLVHREIPELWDIQVPPDQRAILEMKEILVQQVQ